MKEHVAYDDAVDLLDADHKAVKKMFIEHAGLCAEGGAEQAKHQLALRICQALTVHALLEEEVFYPLVGDAIGEFALMDQALEEHEHAKEAIAKIQAMKAGDPRLDEAVMRLGRMIDHHVLKEREQVFLKARRAPLDLRRMTLPLLKLQKQLKRKANTALAKEAL